MSVLDTAGDLTVKEDTPKDVNTQQPDNKDKDTASSEKVIMVDGPLSAVYTKALQLVYGKTAARDNLNIGAETAQTDSSVVIDILKHLPAELLEKPDDGYTYIYATDTKTIQENGINDIFSQVTKRIEDPTCKETVVAIECDRLVTDKQGTLEQYLRDRGVRVLHTKAKLVDYVTRK